jgi:osmotically-inducible protein OsmY
VQFRCKDSAQKDAVAAKELAWMVIGVDTVVADLRTYTLASPSE